MPSTAVSVEGYLQSLPGERQEALRKLREIILKNLPEGFTEMMNYGMPGYVVPHSVYPPGYHCDPILPLPFINIASQKNHIAFYHMVLYADPTLLEWFLAEYPKHSKLKPDMGKSCLRFKKPGQIPFELLGELVRKMTANDWIALYERKLKNSKQ